MDTILAELGGAIAATTGIVEVVKRAGMPARWAPLLALFIGILAVFIFSNGVFALTTIGLGIIVGLSASGLYSGVKTTSGTEVRATVPLEEVKMTAPADTEVKLED